MIRAFEKHQDQKILYIAPVRALCSEKHTLWSSKLKSIQKSCVELIGGDSNGLNEPADLIISTPEKWDYISRNKSIIDSIGLILVNFQLLRHYLECIRLMKYTFSMIPEDRYSKH